MIQGRRILIIILDMTVIGSLLFGAVICGVLSVMSYHDWQLHYWDELSSPAEFLFFASIAVLSTTVAIACWLKKSRISPCRWLRHCAIRI